MNKFFLLSVLYGILFFQSNLAVAGQKELRESLEQDMQYYEKVIKPTGKNAQVNFLNRMIQKYIDKGIDSMYLIAVEEELKTLQKFYIEKKEAIEWRKKEPYGLGFCAPYYSHLFGINGFFDYNISPIVQIHIQIGRDSYNASTVFYDIPIYNIERTMVNISYRRFISTKRGIRGGFYYGFGGGLASTNLDYDFWDVKYSARGKGLFTSGEIGWQGIKGWFFYFGVQFAEYLRYSGNFDKDDVPDVANHQDIAADSWETALRLRHANIGMGWFF